MGRNDDSPLQKQNQHVELALQTYYILENCRKMEGRFFCVANSVRSSAACLWTNGTPFRQS
ncbi:hypothetical protein, partial [uncultured Rikenella sp.]|uniref:hypothetical protein n=1 Tax=uncultured Rikenella sp. TaxID=368003 RepID=UPI002639742D